MAMVLDALASNVLNMLMEAGKEEVGLLLGVSGEIDRMGVQLRDLRNFLADAERRRITDKSVQGWVTELKGAMYEAADILDLCQLKAMEQSPLASQNGCFNQLFSCLRSPLFTHDIGSRIKVLNQRLDNIKERSAAFSFINLGSYDDHGSEVHASHVAFPSRETSGELDRSGVVGEKIEQDTRKLVEIMLSGIKGGTSHANDKVMVYAIVGVGGIGKTTLAQKVFNDDAIQSEFDKTIWVSINQDLNEAELLRRAIIEAGGDHRHAGNAKATLQRVLKNILTGKKVLLVMDDVWNDIAWEDVLKTPLVNGAAPGSRILVTTRDERVARGVKAIPPYHHIDKLDADDAWSLLKKQVALSEIDESDIAALKDIGMEIISKCDGLPLAGKVMGGLLRQKERNHSDWGKVLDDSRWYSVCINREAWEWEEQVKAMPVLEELQLKRCKLRCLPPGLSCHATALRILSLKRIQRLGSLENFASIVDLEVSQNPDLERITDLPVLRKLAIIMCPKMKVLEGVPLLQSLLLEDYGMEALPEYMRDVNPRQLNLDCSIALLNSIAAGQLGPEWAKFSHVGRVKAYAREGHNKRKWYVTCTREPYSLETNIDY